MSGPPPTRPGPKLAAPGRPISRKISTPKKTFTVEPWTGAGEGKKILLYADFGMGKTTLATMLPNPVFIGTDDGGRLIKNPITGADIMHIPGIGTFEDVRGALQTPSLFDGFDTVVVDTITDTEKLAIPYLLRTIPGSKNSVCKNIVAYGWSEGYRHLYDTMRLVLQDCESLVKSGKNVAFIAQKRNIRVANPAGDDFLREAPALYAGNAAVPSIIDCYCEWVDYIFKVGYSYITVEAKKAAGSTERVIYTQPEVYFIAKSRTSLDAEVPFSEPSDDTIWKELFGG